MRNDTAAWHPAHGVPHVRRSLASGPEYPIVWLRQLLRRSHAGGDAWIDCLGGKGPLACGGAHHVQGLEAGAVAKGDLDYKGFLTHALEAESRGRHQRGVESRLKLARLPWLKSLDQDDFDVQPSIDRK